MKLGLPAAAAEAAGVAAAELVEGTQAASSSDEEGGKTRMVVHIATPNPYVTPRSGPTTQLQSGAPTTQNTNGMPASCILEFQDEDAIMQDQAIAVEGGKACLRHHLTAVAVKGILHPIDVFRRQIVAVETNKRIKKATRSTLDKDKAERIASILARERSVTPVLLDGLIAK